jgi:hypothetical protein
MFIKKSNTERCLRLDGGYVLEMVVNKWYYISIE